MTMPVRLVVVEDQGLYLETLCERLGRFPERVRVVGQAEDANEGRAVIEEHRPAAALIDLRLPEAAGIQSHSDVRYGLALVERAARSTRVLVFSGAATATNPAAFYLAFRRGAVGYLNKDDNLGIREIVEAVVRVADGDEVISPSLRDRRAALNSLTTREGQVLDLLATGLSYRDIGSILKIGENTAKTHIANVLGKLELASRDALRLL